MKWYSALLFFGIAMLVYFSVNAYVFRRGWQAFELYPSLRLWYAAIFWLSACSYIVARFVERLWLSRLSDALIWYGSLWLGALVYLFLAVVTLDLIRSWSTIAGHAPILWTGNYLLLKFVAAGIVTLLTAGIVAYGYVNAISPVVREVKIDIPKDGGSKKSWNVVAVTDVHMGTIVDRDRVRKMVDSINRLEPDLVLFGGDTVDEDLAPVIRGNIDGILRDIRAMYGVYGITGNHEFIGGVDAAVSYLSEHGITMLRDEYVLLGDSLILVGREDRSEERFAGTKRQSPDQVLAGVDASRPIIMLDHQPFDLGTVASDGRVDLQISGHTHHGQLWPFTYITDLIYEVSQGMKTIGHTVFYVSPGYGTWGPPIRVGTTPEIVNFRITLH
jgi:predicted MPP superfamily phosphohydrolase